MDDQNKIKLNIASDDVVEKFQEKMRLMGVKEKEQETEKRALSAGVPYVDLRAFPVSQDALALIPKEIAAKKRAACFLFNQEEFRLGSPDADNNAQDLMKLMHEIEERHHSHGGIYLISEESFNHVIKLYERLPIVKPIMKGVTIAGADLDKFSGQIKDLAGLGNLIKNVSTTDLITVIIAASLSLNASDVHIEAEKAGVAVRFRIDGILVDVAMLEAQEWEKIISRIKLVSSLKLNITDKPQDGRFTIQKPEGEIDVRVSTLPTVHGESVVMRILKPLAEISLKELGVSGQALKVLEEQIQRPNGMIITTGPTGSGKTTTLYAVLRELNKPDVKIITLEDPVEYKMPGINQSQIDPSKDYTFATGLRALMRQDPDVAMVGEIRDVETAEVAIQAALTGHLIISTIHSNSAAGAIPRFLSMGVKPFLLAPSLRAVMGQRLVRRLCECKKPIELTDELKKRVSQSFDGAATGIQAPQTETVKFFGPGSCDKCSNLGYRGRIGIYEIYYVNDEIEALILKGSASEAEVKAATVRQGMITLVQDGIFKAAQGLTTLDEVFRVAE